MKPLLIALAVTMILVALGACGVKGDPLPPLQPTDLGRGKPSFKRMSESLKKAPEQKSLQPDAAPNKKSTEEEDEEDSFF